MIIQSSILGKRPSTRIVPRETDRVEYTIAPFHVEQAEGPRLFNADPAAGLSILEWRA